MTRPSSLNPLFTPACRRAKVPSISEFWYYAISLCANFEIFFWPIEGAFFCCTLPYLWEKQVVQPRASNIESGRNFKTNVSQNFWMETSFFHGFKEEG